MNIRIPEAKTQQQCKHSCMTEDEYIQNLSFLRLTVDILHHRSYSLMKHKVFPNQSDRTRHEPKAILLLMQIDSERKKTDSFCFVVSFPSNYAILGVPPTDHEFSFFQYNNKI